MQLTKKEFWDVRNHGFARVGFVIPEVSLANPGVNAQRHIEAFEEAYRRGGMYVIAPELGLTGYSCGDLFHQRVLLDAAREALKKVVDASVKWKMIVSVGVPVEISGSVYNCAVTIYQGKVLMVVPKTYPPEYKEFYELRHFARSVELASTDMELWGERVPVGTRLIVTARKHPCLKIHTSVCEDDWTVIPPGSGQVTLATGPGGLRGEVGADGEDDPFAIRVSVRTVRIFIAGRLDFNDVMASNVRLPGPRYEDHDSRIHVLGGWSIHDAPREDLPGDVIGFRRHLCPPCLLILTCLDLYEAFFEICEHFFFGYHCLSPLFWSSGVIPPGRGHVGPGLEGLRIQCGRKPLRPAKQLGRRKPMCPFQNMTLGRIRPYAGRTIRVEAPERPTMRESILEIVQDWCGSYHHHRPSPSPFGVNLV